MHQSTILKQEAFAANRKWFVISAKGQNLGRLAVRVAMALSGRSRVDFTPHVDAGAYVVVTDAEGLDFTPAKGLRKQYAFHTGFMGGLQETNLTKLHAAKPEKVVQLAVRRMLPKNLQARDIIGRLKVYKGSAHPHVAQAPAELPAY